MMIALSRSCMHSRLGASEQQVVLCFCSQVNYYDNVPK
eukprot:COSAG01_NODE_7204_length_3305_cov_2.458684_1_plen_38_part_00